MLGRTEAGAFRLDQGAGGRIEAETVGGVGALDETGRDRAAPAAATIAVSSKMTC